MSNEHLEFARFLIRRGADPHYESKTRTSPVSIAWGKLLSRTSKSPAALQELVEELDDSEYLAVRNLSTIHKAVLSLTSISLDNAIDTFCSNINSRDVDGRTPLSWAAFRGDFRCVRKLLLNGACTDIPARDGSTPLHMAAWTGSLPCLKILIRHMSNFGYEDRCGNTALHYTCKTESYTQGHLRSVKYLLESGAQVDAEDITGKTLRVCIESSNVEIALLLLKRGANINAYTNDGMTVFLAAVFYNRREFLQLLIKKGAFGDTGVKSASATLKAITQSDAETRNILRMLLDPAIYRSLLNHAQE
ncbi:hypothetical protein ACLMJK_009414 [Lecanora helva]